MMEMMNENGTKKKKNGTSIKDLSSRYANNVRWKELARKRIPIIEWLPKYNLATLAQDTLAGFTVVLTLIPQGIAYAYVAGLEPQYGLYSGIMGCFVYAIFGSCKDVNIGPTAIMALMTQPHVEKLGADMAVLLSFLSGCAIFVLGLLHLGFLVEFFSYPVTAGFTSAAALTIAASQFKSLLGIPGKANAFLDSIIAVWKHIAESRKWDTVLGFTTIVALVFMREFRNFGSLRHRPEWSTRRNVLGRILMILSLSRNAIAVLFGTVLAYICEQNGSKPFTLTGKVGRGLPPFQMPPFSTTFNNTNYDFEDMLKVYGGSVAFVPLIALLECIAIAKAFAKGKTLDATQEMLALGMSNIFGSFVRSMPVTGSFTRTAVNNASGVITPFGNFVTGIIVILALAFLTKTFYYIPKATLAAVVICAMFYLFDYKAIKTLWRSKKIDLIPFFITLLSCVFISLEYGIIIGLGSNLIFILYLSARPAVAVERRKLQQCDVFVATPCRSMQYPAAEFVREKVMNECNEPNTVVVLDGKYIKSIDSTVAKNFKVLIEDVVLRGQRIILWNFKDSAREVCVGIDSGLEVYFKNGLLETIVDDSSEETQPADVVYSIQ